MAYKSRAQEKFFHTDTAKKKGITPDVVDEFDKASKGMSLPEHKDPKPDEVKPGSKSFWRKSPARNPSGGNSFRLQAHWKGQP